MKILQAKFLGSCTLPNGQVTNQALKTDDGWVVEAHAQGVTVRQTMDITSRFMPWHKVEWLELDEGLSKAVQKRQDALQAAQLIHMDITPRQGPKSSSRGKQKPK